MESNCFVSNHIFDSNKMEKFSSKVATEYNYSWCVALLASS